MEVTIEFYLCESSTTREVPKWKRTIGIDSTGKTYIPGAFWTSWTDDQIFLASGWDGVGCAMHLNHCYVPTSWIRKEFPKDKEALEACKKFEDIASAKLLETIAGFTA